MQQRALSHGTSCPCVGRSLPLSGSQFPHLWDEGGELKFLHSSFQHPIYGGRNGDPLCLQAWPSDLRVDGVSLPPGNTPLGAGLGCWWEYSPAPAAPGQMGTGSLSSPLRTRGPKRWELAFSHRHEWQVRDACIPAGWLPAAFSRETACIVIRKSRLTIFLQVHAWPSIWTSQESDLQRVCLQKTANEKSLLEPEINTKWQKAKVFRNPSASQEPSDAAGNASPPKLGACWFPSQTT